MTFDPSHLDFDEPLFRYSKVDVYTLRDSFEGTIIFGSPGSGKTSGSGQAHIRAMLRKGFSGICLTAKANEASRFLNWCELEGRLSSVIRMDIQSGHCLNFLQYELSRPGVGAGMTENVAQLFSLVMERASGSEGSHADPYWVNASKQLLRHSVDVLRLATGKVTLPAVVKVIRTAPRTATELASKDWRQKSFCYRLLERASRRTLDQIDRGDLKQTAGYWLHEFLTLPEKARSSVISTFSAIADGLLRGRLRSMFSGDTSLVPELLESGCILLIDLPVKEFHEPGQAGQNIVKIICQRYWESRVNSRTIYPSFLYCDESQNFVNSHDADFLQTAREAKVATVFITQNIPNYQAAFTGPAGQARVSSLLGNLATKVFHANSDVSTNRYAEEIIGKEWQSRTSVNVGVGEESVNTSSSVSSAFDPVITADVFASLRQGGPQNNYLCDAVIFKSGRIWKATRKNYLKASFKQQ